MQIRTVATDKDVRAPRIVPSAAQLASIHSLRRALSIAALLTIDGGALVLAVVVVSLVSWPDPGLLWSGHVLVGRGPGVRGARRRRGPQGALREKARQARRAQDPLRVDHRVHRHARPHARDRPDRHRRPVRDRVARWPASSASPAERGSMPYSVRSTAPTETPHRSSCWARRRVASRRSRRWLRCRPRTA